MWIRLKITSVVHGPSAGYPFICWGQARPKLKENFLFLKLLVPESTLSLSISILDCVPPLISFSCRLFRCQCCPDSNRSGPRERRKKQRWATKFCKGAHCCLLVPTKAEQRAKFLGLLWESTSYWTNRLGQRMILSGVALKLTQPPGNQTLWGRRLSTIPLHQQSVHSALPPVHKPITQETTLRSRWHTGKEVPEINWSQCKSQQGLEGGEKWRNGGCEWSVGGYSSHHTFLFCLSLDHPLHYLSFVSSFYGRN